MKLKLFLPLTAIIVFVLLLQSCTPENEYGSITSSTAGSAESHNMGQNCMACHKPGGGEAPVWNVAGTVYNETLTATYSNAKVNLFTGPNGTGTLKYSIAVDALGNFFTSSKIDFTGGLYPSVTGSTSTNSMSTPITNGSCFSCHDGVSRNRVWTK